MGNLTGPYPLWSDILL